MEYQTADVRFSCERNTTDDELRQNLAENLKLGLPTLKAGRALIVGGGPSVADHIEDIRAKHRLGFTLFALNGAGAFLNKSGIIPDYIVIYDARPDNAGFAEAEAKEYLVASYSNPRLLKALEGKSVRLFHVVGPSLVIDMVRAAEPGAHFLGGGSTVGMQVLNILIMLGYRVAHLYGYDSCNKEGRHHAYDQALNDGLKRFTFEFRGKYYQSDVAMAAQAREFVEAAPNFEKLGLNLYVFGEGLLPDMWRAEKERQSGITPGVSLEDGERLKYEAMWKVPGYRALSPGEDLVTLFTEACKPQPGDTVLDLGCGSGRATLALINEGLRATGVDIANNCLDHGVKIPFVQANLWDLPKDMTADWVFCTDVMEHIPTEKVMDVLNCINSACKKGAFFSISFTDDSFGAVIGQKLHLTVRNYQWWILALEKAFGDRITYIEETGFFYALKE